jgi:hypothetical protein
LFLCFAFLSQGAPDCMTWWWNILQQHIDHSDFLCSVEKRKITFLEMFMSYYLESAVKWNRRTGVKKAEYWGSKPNITVVWVKRNVKHKQKPLTYWTLTGEYETGIKNTVVTRTEGMWRVLECEHMQHTGMEDTQE